VRLGVLGWPVAHSRSPAMHNAALAAVGLHDWRYQLLPVPPELLAETVPALRGAGFRGANVTIPHKAAALALATDRTERAAAIGAANTLTFEPGGEIVADNTDAPALIAALPFDARGRNAVVLGAGGSARAVVWALAGAGAREVSIWNRSPPRARALADELGATALGADAQLPDADLLVNCTSVGLDGGDPFGSLPLVADSLSHYRCVVDLVYTPSGTRLLDAAAHAGAATVDGLEILVGQGALSFERFTGRAAPLDVMRAAARG
jgi:shikimate dehydrogenase